jgi:nitric oxide reductase subunit C
MAAEEMGRLSMKLRVAFSILSILFVAALAVSPLKDFWREWKRYRKEYVRFAENRPETKLLLANTQPGIAQIWIPDLNVTDRCTTCHQGVELSILRDISVQEPFRGHTPMPHSVTEWGCVVCHRGQGFSTEAHEAHNATGAWEHPMLPGAHIQASCGVCHEAGIPETPRLNRGREILDYMFCVGCHRMQGIERPVMLGPDLTNIGIKTNREWIYKWLKEPHTLTDSDGEVAVNGYESEEKSRMPRFQLKDEEIRDLSAYLSGSRNEPFPPYKFDPRVLAVWEEDPTLEDQGETRFRQMFCTTCHSVAVIRAGETQLIGGDIGPELTKVGTKVNPDWLVAWLRDPAAYLPDALMPRYRWSDEDLYKTTGYIQWILTDPDLMDAVPALEPAQPEELQHGGEIFIEKGCSGCHVFGDVKTPTDFGPDLSSLGKKTVSELMFDDAEIPRSLIAYIQAKISDPASVNDSARMPQYNFKKEDLGAVTTALLSMTGLQRTPGLARLVVPAPRAEFHPAGEFGVLYERYKCDVCHRFNGFGSALAPDLSYSGSRAQREWVISFLKNPQTIRPTLIFRMPQFNMTDSEADTIADYLEMVMQSPLMNAGEETPQSYEPQTITLGKQLYEVKYECQSCHIIGSKGGYIGPSLNDAGNWLNRDWIEAWLKNPQALVPEAIEPRRDFTNDEIRALTAYLLSLKRPAGEALMAGGSQ